MTTVILGQWLLYAADAPPERKWGVAVDVDRVTAIGPHADLLARFPAAEVVDATGGVIAPGFVNAHQHLYGVLSHGIPLDRAPQDFWAFLEEFWWPRLEDALDHDLIRAAVDMACLEMVRCGVTTFYDVLEAPLALPGCLQAEAEVVRRWGLRGVLSFEATQRVSRENGELGLHENVEFIEACRQTDGLVSGLMCFHTTFTCSADFIRRAFELGEQHAALVHFHCSEGRYEPEYTLKHFGRRPVEHYAKLGVLSSRAFASQCVQIDQREIELLAQHGARVSHMPLSNCEVGGGIAPVPALLAAGVPVSLGTDGYVNNYFALMRGAFLIHKAHLENPQVMPAHVVWKMATLNGVHDLKLADRIGQLRPGYSADLILIDADTPTPLSAGNLLDQLLLWRDPGNIQSVMCAGRWLMRDREVIGVDEARIRARCREAAERLWKI
ncbi:MAG TPA: amidohydrolase family protein [Anaerolineae bacterium]|nr:amidohydrolase family protein [Anaerolineae bacterium]